MNLIIAIAERQKIIDNKEQLLSRKDYQKHYWDAHKEILSPVRREQYRPSKKASYYLRNKLAIQLQHADYYQRKKLERVNQIECRRNQLLSEKAKSSD